MSASRIVAQMASVGPISRHNLRIIINLFFGMTARYLRRGTPVRVPRFGTFSVRMRKARRGFNPRTRTPITIPAAKVIRFTPARALRRTIQ